MERLITDLRAALPRIRPWVLRAAAILRAGALVTSARLLSHAGAVGLVIAVWLAVTGAGLWRRRIWPWRAALLGDIALVLGMAFALLETADLQLFTVIASAAVADILLLSFGQLALDPGEPEMLPPPST
jgi:hypothetical protein